ncbi:MAG TPA: two-component regulator propeller domain-containing protein, partial [Bacteroidia bacterium]|nr:two-component regulator propeller domain-containing protein [Bacteroidia bacterium]
MPTRFIAQIAFRLLSAAILLLPASVTHAQDYKFSHLGVKDGLSQAVINCILQDSRGFMWFGTQEGLNQYDGYTFHVFKRDPEDTNSLSNNFIYSIAEDKQGILWIGTNGGGLNSFDPATLKFTRYLSDPKDSTTISNDVVRTLFVDKKGTLWVGTDAGLNQFDAKNKKFRRFLTNPDDPYSIAGARVTCIIEDRDEDLWIGTYGTGISHLDMKSRRFYNYQMSESDIDRFYPHNVFKDPQRRKRVNQVRSILFNTPEMLWVGTDGGGIEVFNVVNHSYESILYPGSSLSDISSNVITSMQRGPNNDIWIGVFEAGLDILKMGDHSIEHYGPTNDPYSLNSKVIKRMFRDKQGNM